MKNTSKQNQISLHSLPIIVGVVGMLLLYSVVMGKEIDPKVILEKIDSHRGFQDRSFSMEIKVDSTIAGKSREQVELVSYIDNTDPNKWNTMVRTTAPAKRKGQLLLLENNRMWFYKPGTRRPIRISPAQRLLGSASTGDVASFNFREFYDIESVEEVKLGKVEAYLLKLKAAPNTAATYPQTRLWAQKKTFFPIKAEFYAKSGRKLKTCYYGGFKKILKIARVTEMTIVDGLKPENITKIHILTMKPESLPQSYYNPNRLTEVGF